MATPRLPTASAKCIGPVSPVMNRSSFSMTAAKPRRPTSPIKRWGVVRHLAATCSTRSRSAGAPVRMTFPEADSVNPSTRVENRNEASNRAAP